MTNKRIRKKSYRGEFREFGFHLYWTFKKAVGSEDFLDALINHIEKTGLSFGGGHRDRVGSGFITHCSKPWSHKGRCLSEMGEGHREVVDNFFKGRPEVLHYAIGPLEDANHYSGPKVELKLLTTLIESHGDIQEEDLLNQFKKELDWFNNS